MESFPLLTVAQRGKRTGLPYLNGWVRVPPPLWRGQINFNWTNLAKWEDRLNMLEGSLDKVLDETCEHRVYLVCFRALVCSVCGLYVLRFELPWFVNK